LNCSKTIVLQIPIHSPILITLMLICPAHSLTLLVIIPSYSLTLMVTCSSYSLFWSTAILIHSFGHLPILFILLVTCSSYSLFWSLVHLIHPFGQFPILFTLLVIAYLIHSFGHLPSYSHYLLATFPRNSRLFILCSFNSIFKNLVTHSI
jgi:hypothetical protein